MGSDDAQPPSPSTSPPPDPGCDGSGSLLLPGVKLFLGGLNWATSDDTLCAHFSEFGELEDVAVMRDRVTGTPRGFGFVTFTTPEAAAAACEVQHLIDGNRIFAKQSVPHEARPRSKKVFVGGLAPETTNDEFREYFTRFGGVVDAQIMVDHASGRSRGFGFVTFDDEAAAAATQACPPGSHIIAGKPVEVKAATPRGSGPIGNPGGGGGMMTGGVRGGGSALAGPPYAVGGGILRPAAAAAAAAAVAAAMGGGLPGRGVDRGGGGGGGRSPSGPRAASLGPQPLSPGPPQYLQPHPHHDPAALAASFAGMAVGQPYGGGGGPGGFGPQGGPPGLSAFGIGGPPYSLVYHPAAAYAAGISGGYVPYYYTAAAGGPGSGLYGGAPQPGGGNGAAGVSPGGPVPLVAAPPARHPARGAGVGVGVSGSRSSRGGSGGGAPPSSSATSQSSAAAEDLSQAGSLAAAATPPPLLPAMVQAPAAAAAAATAAADPPPAAEPAPPAAESGG